MSPPPRAPRLRLRPFPGRGLALLLVLAIAGCRGVEVTGTAGARGGTAVVGTGGGMGGGGSTVAALLGRWARTVVLTGSDGSIHESRTEWEFFADGTATRRVTTWNVTAGVGDTIVAVAQWRTSGSTVTIAWLSPSAGTAVFDWSVRGDVLTLGGVQYARVR